MVFKEYTYSVLIVSSSEKFYRQILPMLPENEFDPKVFVQNSDEARRLLSDRAFDIVLINAPLTDDFGSKLASDIAADSKSGVLMFVKNDIYEEVTAKVIDSGVFTLSKPAASSTVSQVLNIMYAMQERFKMLGKKTVSLEEKMEEIRIVNRAKWILIKNVNLSEDEAHRLIEKQSMDQRKSKREIAESIIRTYEN